MPKNTGHPRKEFQVATCRDGFSMSVQASRANYCMPRNNVGPWYSVEVGFPSTMDMLLWPYAEDPSDPTETVYSWVPSQIVYAVIEAHGGMVSGEIPDMIVKKEHADEG